MLRDGWLMVGIGLLMFLALEGPYRLQGAVRRQLRGADPVDSTAALPKSHPYADSAWYPIFLRERRTLTARWEPFVYTRLRPVTGRYVHGDSAGLRPVPRYRVPSGTPLRVFEFGGSTTWGYYDRDSSQRPAVEARRLAAAGFDAEVLNYGQLGYVSAQELLALVLELRRGNVPDAVVFWDGVNDVASARLNGRPGVGFREGEYGNDFEFNLQRRKRGMRVDDALALRSLASHSQLLARLFDITARPERIPPVPEPVGFCRRVMLDWVNQAKMIDHLAKAYGFVALTVWQPQWATSGRPQSEYERTQAAPKFSTPSDSGLDPHRIECSRMLDSVVATHTSESIVNLARLHSDDTATVFIDRFGHTAERATAIEGDTVAVLLIARLKGHPRGARSSPGTRTPHE
jgi:hypothetical protein